MDGDGACSCVPLFFGPMTTRAPLSAAKVARAHVGRNSVAPHHDVNPLVVQYSDAPQTLHLGNVDRIVGPVVYTGKAPSQLTMGEER